jgi:anthranilate phosphoribosyltransferase
VYDRARTEMLAQALAEMGARRVLVVAGHDGMDEITLTGPTRVSEADQSAVTTRDVVPEDFGLARAAIETLKGGDASANALLLREILAGAAGPLRDVVLANASAALVVAGKAHDFIGGVALARQALDSGAALVTLNKLVQFTQQAAS